ncbi:MAG: radical SAM protein [Aigarchaeota archaeon]|nr:radical SAM protein [Aigarchaeota archaeon]
MISLLEAWEKKRELLSMLKEKLSQSEFEESKKDPHSLRPPRPCGLTVHTGFGCAFCCVYCYIYDMGFTSKPRPYPLSGLQISYAISSNPSVAIGVGGTPLAFGAITEPFMDESRKKTLEYISTISSYLGNPIQFSTKTFIERDLASEIRKSAEKVSALVTIVTTSLYKLLEPKAPSPDERFMSIENLSRAGVHTVLFLRPILPGMKIDEVEEIVSRSLDAGARGIVVGSMRVTEKMIRRLKCINYPYMDDLLKRIPGMVRGDKQVTLRMNDLKKMVYDEAWKLGARIYPSACAANMDAHGISCNACDMGPCGDPDNLPGFELDEVRALGKYYEIRVEKVIPGDALKIKASGDKMRIKQFVEFAKWVTKRKVLAKS